MARVQAAALTREMRRKMTERGSYNVGWFNGDGMLVMVQITWDDIDPVEDFVYTPLGMATDDFRIGTMKRAARRAYARMARGEGVFLVGASGKLPKNGRAA